MRKFKKIFYPIYLIFSLVFVYMSIDSFSDMQSSQDWFGRQFSAENQPYWVMTFFLILALLMLVEIVAENIHLHQVKKGIEELEEEIVRLKAKLFDQLDEGEEEDEEGEENESEEEDADS